MTSNAKLPDNARLDRIVAEARRASDERATGYREQALKLYPWICGRCAREFDRSRIAELTVHHRDHNHDNNPPDGSNWELLCVYCHDNEHQRQLEAGRGQASSGTAAEARATHQPFADLKARLQGKKSIG
ncbi:MAG: YajD family HNH nuclease [Casimicrobiaceae bacterium]